MNIRKMNKEELEQLSYTDITYYILKENTNPKTTKELFSEIMELLGLPESTYSGKIGDYYTALTTDKRFTILKDGRWDLKINQSSENFITIMDEDEEIEIDEEELISEEEIEIDEEEVEIELDEDEELNDTSGDVLEELSIIEEDFEI